MAILVIGGFSSRCDACGLGADPDETTHATVPGHRARRGCRAAFTAMSTDREPTPDWVLTLHRMRPDLSFVRQHAPLY